jgi:hypothetical protein
LGTIPAEACLTDFSAGGLRKFYEVEIQHPCAGAAEFFSPAPRADGNR